MRAVIFRPHLDLKGNTLSSSIEKCNSPSSQTDLTLIVGSTHKTAKTLDGRAIQLGQKLREREREREEVTVNKLRPRLVCGMGISLGK
jgi:hypothetical protein